jgi:hypothetical protein
VTQWCPKLPCPCVTVHTNKTGSAVYVIGGTGQGQMRTVANGGPWMNRTVRPPGRFSAISVSFRLTARNCGSRPGQWVLEAPFGGEGGGVALDETSIVTFNDRRERNIYRGAC